MAWRIFQVSGEKKEALEEVLKDDVLWRPTRIFKDASLYGGKAGEYYLYMNGSEDAMKRADGMVPPLGAPVTGEPGEKIYLKIKDEEDRAASGMGLIFAE